MEEIKQCKKCNISKPLNLFNKVKGTKDGHRGECKKCESARSKEWRLKNKEKIKIKKKEYYEENKIEILAQQKEYNKNNPEVKRKSSKKAYHKDIEKSRSSAKNRSLKYYYNNQEQCQQNSLEYYYNNKEERLEYHYEYMKDKYHNDPEFKLHKLISIEINKTLKAYNNRKNSSILKYLPYTIKELKAHIENLFEPWMTWNNWGIYDPRTWKDNNSTTWTWQLDHIIPRAQLQYSSMQDVNFLKCWALLNLRPLSAKQNIKENYRT